tara:strand:- start:1664 stop:2023 length:360 start_codon:yes stop_codon:yes gene_type:complete
MRVTLENAKRVRLEAFAAAVVATQKYIDEVLKGEDAYTCGFAWVTVDPKHKGNTKEGRQERKIFAALDLQKDWTEKRFQWWNPSKCYFQNIDCKEQGALAAAKVLKSYGLDAWMGSRLD